MLSSLSTASPTHTSFQLSTAFGPLLAVTHPFLFIPSQGFSPLKDTATPSPNAEQLQGLLAQHPYRNSAANLSSHLPEEQLSACASGQDSRESDRENSLGKGEAGWEGGAPHRELGGQGGEQGDRVLRLTQRSKANQQKAGSHSPPRGPPCHCSSQEKPGKLGSYSSNLGVRRDGLECTGQGLGLHEALEPGPEGSKKYLRFNL